MSSRQKGSVPQELKIEAKHAITIDDLVKNIVFNRRIRRDQREGSTGFSEGNSG